MKRAYRSPDFVHNNMSIPMLDQLMKQARVTRGHWKDKYFQVKKQVWMLFAGMISLLAACQQGTSTVSDKTLPADVHRIIVDNILQASKYTYLHGRDTGADLWVAVPAMMAKMGATYYYKGGLQMTKFESKELNKVFESVTLLEGVSTDPNTAGAPPPAPATGTTAYADAPATTGTTAMDAPPAGHDDAGQYKRTSAPPEKKEVKVDAAKGGITIAALYANKDSYAGKTVRIKGQVTKYTPDVMNKNWVHIQDGTDNGGKFDLAITTGMEAQLGETVTIEGKVSLNKDLGYGYFFDVIVEDATIKIKGFSFIVGRLDIRAAFLLGAATEIFLYTVGVTNIALTISLIVLYLYRLIFHLCENCFWRSCAASVYFCLSRAMPFHRIRRSRKSPRCGKTAKWCYYHSHPHSLLSWAVISTCSTSPTIASASATSRAITMSSPLCCPWQTSTPSKTPAMYICLMVPGQ